MGGSLFTVPESEKIVGRFDAPEKNFFKHLWSSGESTWFSFFCQGVKPVPLHISDPESKAGVRIFKKSQNLTPVPGHGTNRAGTFSK